MFALALPPGDRLLSQQVTDISVLTVFNVASSLCLVVESVLPVFGWVLFWINYTDIGIRYIYGLR